MSKAAVFPGEPFFQVHLPNYGRAHTVVPALLIISFVFWILVFPVFFSKEKSLELTPQQEARTPPAPTKKKSKSSVAVSESPASDSKKQVIREVPIWVSALALLGFLATSLVVLWYAPYNSWLSRRVFEAPLLTRDECNEIVERAMAAAERNAQNTEARLAIVGGWENLSEKENHTLHMLMDHPSGWQKLRHQSYPTTDLNLVTDPFTKEDRDFIGGLMDRRLAPLLARIYGIPEGSIRSNDMFVVRYDVGKRTKLANHSDDGDISFNILLTDTFQGGGTKFWDRSAKESFAHVEPAEPGTALIHSALIHHEGIHVSEGTRIILVGFTSVDRIDPWQQTWTGLSWLASYANLNFLTVKFKGSVFNAERRLQGNQFLVKQWDEFVYIRQFFWDVYEIGLAAVDSLSTHAVEYLVAPKDRTKFIQALEDGYRDNNDKDKGRASWFKGQQVRVNVDGTLESEWSTRRENLNRFKEL
ncbi:hypothetical protein ACA910_000493 [Epithemia clementina (nom. ined.)]